MSWWIWILAAAVVLEAVAVFYFWARYRTAKVQLELACAMGRQFCEKTVEKEKAFCETIKARLEEARLKIAEHRGESDVGWHEAPKTIDGGEGG